MAAKRLNFSIPEFIRTIWVSDEARSTWEPRISAVSIMFQQLEREAVSTGLKPATLQVCNPEQIPEMVRWCLTRDLILIPLNQIAETKQYANTTAAYDPRKPWTYRIVIGSEKIVRNFVHYWDTSNHEAVGDCLGFPLCCQEFFNRVWVKDGWRDTTYPMVMNDADSTFKVGGPSSCNILLRWLGVRIVSHLPCSFGCEESEKIGRKMFLLAENLFPKEAQWLQEMLNWPIRWDSLHGVSIVTTPIVRVLTSSDALSERTVIDRDGSVYPKEGISGIEFPFKIINTLKFVRKNPEDEWTDNGFGSKKAMTEAHDILLGIINHLPHGGHPRVMDMGCGNGLLLEKIEQIFPGSQLSGVEVDPIRWKRACHRLMGYKPTVFYGDLNNEAWWDPPYDLTIISCNRLLELNPKDQTELLERISHGSEFLLIYSYDGKLQSCDDFRAHFESYLSGLDNGTGTEAHLLRSRNEVGRAPSSLGQTDSFSARRNGIGKHENANNRRIKNG